MKKEERLKILEELKKTSFNRLQGNEVANELAINKMWWKRIRVERNPIGMIDTLFIMPTKKSAILLFLLCKGWNAQEVDWEGNEVRVWWD